MVIGDRLREKMPVTTEYGQRVIQFKREEGKGEDGGDTGIIKTRSNMNMNKYNRQTIDAGADSKKNRFVARK